MEFWKIQSNIHLGIQLIASKQVRDKGLKKMYMEVTHGMMSLADLLVLLKVATLFTYYKRLGQVIRKYSIQNKKLCTCCNI